jgi:peroxiredoxin Q/BCP
MAKKPSKKPVKKAAKKPAKKAIKKASKKRASAKASERKPAKKAAKKPAKKVAKKPAKKIVKAKPKPEVKANVVKKPVKRVTKSILNKPLKIVAKKPLKPVEKKPHPKDDPKFKPYKTHLKVGERAPFFEGIDQHGNTISSYLLGGRNIVLYFYPKDDTDGCTAQACSLRDEHYFLGANNYVVVGVSADDKDSHAKFATKYSLPFPLIADTNMDIIKAFDVWGKKQLAGKIYDGIVRTTFIIGADGIIKHIITNVDTKEHAKQILAL